jgi:RNA polymerase sigma-70 factor, ECF subfamily
MEAEPGTGGREQSYRMQTVELEATLRRARLGDQAALTDLHRSFAPRVLGLCRHMLGTLESAEDAANEIFLRLSKVIAGFDGSIPFERWLFKIAGNHCIDILRKRSREQKLIVQIDAEALPVAISPTSPLNELLHSERAEAVRAAVESLPPKYRVPLALRYYGDLSYDEIAEQLGMKRPHVATLIFRAKQELRQSLAAYRGEEPA